MYNDGINPDGFQMRYCCYVAPPLLVVPPAGFGAMCGCSQMHSGMCARSCFHPPAQRAPVIRGRCGRQRLRKLSRQACVCVVMSAPDSEVLKPSRKLNLQGVNVSLVVEQRSEPALMWVKDELVLEGEDSLLESVLVVDWDRNASGTDFSEQLINHG